MYQWIDIKLFKTAADTPLDDTEILRGLIGSSEYRDDYVGGGIDPDGTRHGPYWLSAISPESFELVSPNKAVEIVQNWVGNCRGVPATLHSAVRVAVIDPIRASNAVFALRDLGPAAKNDYGDLHVEFHELVTVSREDGRVALIVLTDD